MSKSDTRTRKFGLWRRAKSEDGSSTIEAVLWVPLLATLLMLVVDTSFVFYGRAQAMRIVQDGNRAYSLGRFESDAEASAFIYDTIKALAPGAEVETVLNTSTGVIATTVKLPVDDLMVAGNVAGLGSGFFVWVTAQHYAET